MKAFTIAAALATILTTGAGSCKAPEYLIGKVVGKSENAPVLWLEVDGRLELVPCATSTATHKDVEPGDKFVVLDKICRVPMAPVINRPK